MMTRSRSLFGALLHLLHDEDIESESEMRYPNFRSRSPLSPMRLSQSPMFGGLRVSQFPQSFFFLLSYGAP